MGPMGIQCDKLQGNDLDHYRQPLQEKRRGHGKTGKVPTTNRFKEVRAHKLRTCIKRHRRKTVTLRLVYVVRIFVFQQQKIRKLYVLRGVWPVDVCAGYERGGFMPPTAELPDCLKWKRATFSCNL